MAVTLTVYTTEDAKPVTTIGEEAPVAVLVVCPAAVAVTVNEVAAGDSAGSSKAVLAAPSLYGRFVPTSVATTLIGASGSRKSFDACDFLPVLFPAAIFSLS